MKAHQPSTIGQEQPKQSRVTDSRCLMFGEWPPPMGFLPALTPLSHAVIFAAKG